VTGQAPRSARGRQAEARRNDERVLVAAREVVAVHGADASVAAIAARAGVGMGSLYRRYGSKADLLRRLCLLAMDHAIEAAETALREPDPWAGLVGYIHECVARRTGALTPLAGGLCTTPQMRRSAARAHLLLERLVADARRDGRLRPDATAPDIVSLLELFARHGPTGADMAARDRLLAITLDGLRAPGAVPLPGPPPDLERYRQRWDGACQEPPFGPESGLDPGH
jgi:AcrR family transcriptional regulator